jgi:hypothetical protein
MSKLYIPTAQEFKKTFKLDAAYKIPRATLIQYANYVAGSYKLYHELVNIGKKKPIIITFKGKKEKIVLSCERDNDRGWQTFVSPLGSRMKLEASYIDPYRDKEKGSSTPFWTHTKFGDDVHSVIGIVYSYVKHMMHIMSSKYESKYRLRMEWRSVPNNSMMYPIWLDGCEFTIGLEIKDKKGISRFIDDYEIKQSITNRSNIWTGNILPAVQKIIDSVKP